MPELSFLEKLFVFLQHIVPQHWLSRLVAVLADTRQKNIKDFLIAQFIDQFDVDMSQAANPDPKSYPSFNHFFTRELADGARPIDASEHGLCSPADGKISECGPLDGDRLLQAKGYHYDLETLLGGDAELATQFVDGHFSTIYLSPRDYHRIHMPCTGKLLATHYIPGKLFSVNDVTANSVPQLFSRNERLVCVFESERGPFVMILVGAMIVAGIETVWAGQVTPLSKVSTKLDFAKEINLEKGAEMGRFKLGSTVILLFPKGMLDDDSEQLPQTGDPVQMGQLLARFDD